METPYVKPVYTILELVRDFGVSRTAVFGEIKAGRLKVSGGVNTRIAGEDALAGDSFRNNTAKVA